MASSNSALGDHALVAARGQQGRFVDEVGEIGAGETGRTTSDHLGVDIGRQRHVAHVNLEDLLAAHHVRIRHDDLAVEAARTQQRRIEHVGTVGGGHEDHALIGFKAIHLDEELVQRLLALVIAAAEACATMTADSVDFVDEDDAGRVLLGLLEHVTHTRCADTDEHFNEVRTRDREERHIGFAGDGTREQRLAGARRADQQRTLRNLAAEALELVRILQEVDDLDQIILGLFDTSHVVERHLAVALRQTAWPCDLPKPMALPQPDCICRMKKIHTPISSTIGSQ